jgi:hypothetical protein
MRSGVDPIELVERLKGKAPWGVRLGVGSFLTMEFGRPETNVGDRAAHGEFHLWFCMCSWRIETGERVIVGSEDERPAIEAVLKNLGLGSVEKIELVGPSLDLAIQFGPAIRVLTFSASSARNQEQWMLFMPDGNCLTVYGDGSYEYAPSNEPRPRSD